MATTGRSKPNPFQLVRYCLGRRLPDSMLDWVREDLTGKGATRRMMLRVLVPAVLILAPFLFVPTSWDVRLSMTIPILIPFIYFSHALNKIWRRHMLVKNGIDPKLLEQSLRQKNAHIHAAYEERYGRRSDDGTGSTTI